MLNPNLLSERQKLIIKLGLLQYGYIMNHRNNPNDLDFQKVYTDFYLSAQPKVSQPAYFNYFNNVNSNTRVTTVENYLYKNLKKKGKKGNITNSNLNLHEFSFSTKMLHTVDDSKPIFDSKIEDYLKKQDSFNDGTRIGLLWSRRYENKIKNTYTVSQIIDHDYCLLNKWYDERLSEINSKKGRGYNYIKWFDKEFGKFIKCNNIGVISDVKKIDFMIFAHMS